MIYHQNSFNLLFFSLQVLQLRFSFSVERLSSIKILRKWSLFCREEARLSDYLADWFLLSRVLMYLLWDRLSYTRSWRRSLEKVEKEWSFIDISHAKWQMKLKGNRFKSSWRKWLFAQQNTLTCDTTKCIDLWHIVDVSSYGFRKSLHKLKKKIALKSGKCNGWHLWTVICVCVCVCVKENIRRTFHGSITTENSMSLTFSLEIFFYFATLRQRVAAGLIWFVATEETFLPTCCDHDGLLWVPLQDICHIQSHSYVTTRSLERGQGLHTDLPSPCM